MSIKRRNCTVTLATVLALVTFGCATMPEPPDYTRRVRRLVAAASRYHDEGDAEKALVYYKRALDMNRGTDDRGGTLDCLQSLAVIYCELGNFDQAAEAVAEATSIACEIGNTERQADLLGISGNIWYARGDSLQAEDSYRAALAISETTGYVPGIANQHNSLGLILKRRGEYEEAVRHYNSAARVYQKLGDKRGHAACLNNVGALLEAQSDFQAALEKYNQALALDKAAGNTPGIAVCLHNLGSVHLKLGAPEKAAGYFQRAYHVNSWIGRDSLAAQDLREAEKARAVP